MFDDARTVWLESRHPDGGTMAVGVLIDRNLGGLAKDVLLADSIEQVAGAVRRGSDGEKAELVGDSRGVFASRSVQRRTR